MKKIATTFIVINLIMSSCVNNKSKDTENELLRSKVDSLENLISTSFSPIIINNNYSPDFKEGDSINFVVGLMWNKSELIDSIELHLYNDLNKKIAPNQYNVENLVSDGFSYYSLSKLNAGKYTYEGNLYFRNKAFPLYYEIEIDESNNR